MSSARRLLRSLLQRKRIVIFVLLAFLALLVCLLLNSVDLQLLLRWSDRVPILPTARAEYRQILDRIAGATNDDLLLDETKAEPRIYREGLGCIAAQGHRTFGTNRPHADILADYAKAFSTMGWKTGDAGVGTKTIGVQVVFVDPISPDYSTLGKGRYQTIYRVNVVYSDPHIFGCFG
jgi:hypothetical protein